MKKETSGTILALLTALISGFAIPVNKLFVVGLDPTVFTAVRALIIGIVFLILASYQSKFDFRKFKHVPWKYLVGIAVIGGSFAFLLFFTGLQLTTAGRGAFLHKTLPLYATLFAFLFLKEKVSRKQLYAMLAMVAGTALIYLASIPPAQLWSNPSLGDIMIIGATILWGLENVIARAAMLKKETNLVVSFARMFIGSVILFAAVILMGKLDVLFSLSSQQIINLFISTGMLFGYVLCWYWSIKLINVSKASALLLIAPVISLLLGMAMFGEPVLALQLLGSAIILVGAYFVVNIKSRLATGV